MNLQTGEAQVTTRAPAARTGSRRRRSSGEDPPRERVVVDASFAVKWVLPEQHSDRAVELLREWKAKRIQPVAPALMAVEAANAIYKRVRRGELSPSEGKVTLRTLLQAGILFQGDQHLCSEAWDIARQFDRPTVYDAVYLALALALGCDLWTGDERLYNSVKGKLSWVRWVGEPR